jgi:rare lipoprotein A
MVMVLIVVLFSSCSTSKHLPLPEYPSPTDSTETEESAELDGSLPLTDQESALASWYGSEFHGKPTASGQRYDMYALTCAHRELPFGVHVRVTNPQNGKSVVVTVNDRGPLKSSREFDLSYEAARRIGMVSHGITRIRYQVLEDEVVASLTEETPSIKPEPAESVPGKFTVQVGAFIDPDNAAQLTASLRDNGYEVHSRKIKGKKSTLHCVLVGSTLSRSDAFGLLKSLQGKGYQAYVVSL